MCPKESDGNCINTAFIDDSESEDDLCTYWDATEFAAWGLFGAFNISAEPGK
jgi:hypothetical protein